MTGLFRSRIRFCRIVSSKHFCHAVVMDAAVCSIRNTRYLPPRISLFKISPPKSSLVEMFAQTWIIQGNRPNCCLGMIQTLFNQPLFEGIHQLAVLIPIHARSSHIYHRIRRYRFLVYLNVKAQQKISNLQSTSMSKQMVNPIKMIFKNFFKRMPPHPNAFLISSSSCRFSTQLST